MRRTHFVLILPLISLFLTACATPPPPEPMPGLRLELDGASARVETPDSVSLELRILIVNGGSAEALPGAMTGQVNLDGVPWPLRMDPPAAPLAPGASVSVPVSVSLPMPAPIPPAGDQASEDRAPETAALAPWTAVVSMDTIVGGEPGTLTLSASGTVPRIGRPSFTVTSIAIRQADLINTRLLVSLRVHNPNAFPVSLGGFSYELHGEGRYWASGSLARPSPVPALGSADITLELTMNFTTMNRQVLDQVMNLERLAYRLKGTVTVDMGLEVLPPFTLPFNLSDSVTVAR